jgi:hypothetical protein
MLVAFLSNSRISDDPKQTGTPIRRAASLKIDVVNLESVVAALVIKACFRGITRDALSDGIKAIIGLEIPVFNDPFTSGQIGAPLGVNYRPGPKYSGDFKWGRSRFQFRQPPE